MLILIISAHSCVSCHTCRAASVCTPQSERRLSVHVTGEIRRERLKQNSFKNTFKEMSHCFMQDRKSFVLI